MMTIKEFTQINSRLRGERPKLFLLTPSDRLASDADLERVEQALGFALPVDYAEFLKKFGGGSFGLVNVFSADPGSEFYLPKKQAEASSYLPSGLLAVSDDYAGGNYVLKLTDDRVLAPVFYWNQDGGLVPTSFSNILEFIARYAYNPA